jgi:hypothetical protein
MGETGFLCLQERGVVKEPESQESGRRRIRLQEKFP